MSTQQSRQQTRHTASNPHSAPMDNPFGSDNYYKLLNVPYDATRAQITKAYRQSMMRAHPDRAHPSRRAEAEEIARMLNVAYATLTDPVRREDYDRSIQQETLQNEIMSRYVGGVGFGGAHTPTAEAPRRQMTERERRERQVSNRSAMITIFSAFGMVALAAIGLLMVFALLTLTLSAVF